MWDLCLCADCVVFGCVLVNVRHSVGFWMFLHGVICVNVC